MVVREVPASMPASWPAGQAGEASHLMPGAPTSPLVCASAPWVMGASSVIPGSHVLKSSPLLGYVSGPVLESGCGEDTACGVARVGFP